MIRHTQHIADLSPEEKRALLGQILRTEKDKAQSPIPMSPTQAAMWFMHRIAPDSAAYNVMFTARVRAAVDIPTLRRAFQTLLDRHVALRTTFAAPDGRPIQRIHKSQPVHLVARDASSWSEAELNEHLMMGAHRPFDLEKGPLLRVSLFTRSAGEHILLLTVHHIAVDSWSLLILADELRALYSMLRADVAMTLPPQRWQYTDFLRWQANMLAGSEGGRMWAFWKKKLAGELPVLDLPTDRPRPSIQTDHGAWHAFRLSEELTRSLRALARSEGTTLFTVLLAAYQVLLHRYARQDDILVGTPTSGRDRADWADLVGYLVNPVVIRGDLSGSPKFRAFLNQMRRTVLEAIEHAHYPFPLLVKRLQPARDRNRSPIFQVMFSLQESRRPENACLAVAAIGKAVEPTYSRGFPVEPIALEQHIAQFDLLLMLAEADGALEASFQYNTDLFEPTTVARMAGHYETLLGGIVANPDSSVSKLPLLTEAERRLLIVELNDSAAEYPSESCVHELFEAQVERTPDAVAVVYGNTRLTYRELNQRADQLARYIAALGVGPETRVGLCVERSPDLLVAMFGIVKAGGAYVPLDPTYPRNRLTYMMEDSQAPVLITQKHLAAALPETAAKLVYIDSDWDVMARTSGEYHSSGVRPDNLVYVLYTSGSTGKPKGVMITHRGLVNYLHWCVKAYSVADGQGAPVVSSIASDLTVTSLFSPLLCGKAVTLLPQGGGTTAVTALLPSGLDDYSLIKITPAHLDVLAQQLLQEETASRTRVLIVGGESLFGESLRCWREQMPDTRIINEYGPTETVVGCCAYEVPPRGAISGPVPIGRPIANTQLYVLDAHLQPVPIGVPGELYIGSPGVARGYLNQPKLTAAKFIPDPFSLHPGARLYKSGDLCRYLSDGNLEYLGRIDHQLKIHGYRIEPGEIEAALACHPGVRHAVVVAREGELGGRHKGLVAYLVTNGSVAPNVSELRQFLKKSLPNYMVPGVFVFLEAIPTTQYGKVDRRALPSPDSRRPELNQTYVAPRTATEKVLADIFAHVLRVEQVGVHDNFFDLGGASIQTLEVVTRAEEAGLDLTPDLLFEHQTIAELAAAIGPFEPTVSDESREAATVEPTARPAPVEAAPGSKTRTIIESLGVYLPPKVVTTAEVIRGCKSKLLFPLERMTGIRSRRMAGEKEFSYDLAVQAVADCMARSQYGPQDIDLLVCCNISRYDGPDFQVSFEPSTSVRLRNRFGLTRALTFDISNACAGMFTGIQIVDTYIKSGLIRSGMVVSGEYTTHLTQAAQKVIQGFMDPALACLTVGDAGAAMILVESSDDKAGFHELDMYTLGRYSGDCIAKATDAAGGGTIMLTDAVKSSAIAIQQAVMSSTDVLERSAWSPDDFQHLIMHQTSETALRGAMHAINDHYGRRLCHEGNTILNVAEYGNTATTTHALALMENIMNGRIKSGDRVVFGISGSGQTVGTGLYIFDDLPDRLRRKERSGRRPGI